MAKKEFVSNVTGEEWRKEYLKQWKRVINQVGVVIEDEIHNAKHNTTITLKAGTKVIVDDTVSYTHLTLPTIYSV